MTNPHTSIHSFKAEGLDGGTIDFGAFKGKKILVVNVASECGYTPQYAQLQELYEQFAGKLVIVGFPCNDFGGQEPGGSDDIKSFCERNYGVGFPMAAKVTIKGSDKHPVYAFLTEKVKNGVMDTEVRWNFGKFLLDEEGRLMDYFPSDVSPLAEEIVGRL